MAEPSMDKLNHDVEKFLVTYRFLTAEGKAAFESQLEASIKGMDRRTRRLYMVLLASAKEGLSKEQTIAKMQEAENHG